jgi:ABC-type transporter Mla subunit MlaD
MKRILAILVVLGAIAAAVSLTAASPNKPLATYKIEFDNIFGLTEGGDLTVAGVKAGKTPIFELTDDERPKALVTAEIQKPGFTPFRADAHCDIRQQNLIGTYYISCQPGKSPRKLPNGAVIPVEQTTSTIPIDLVNSVLRRPYKERFRIILAELGTGLAGRPEDLQDVLRRAHPGLRETSKTLKLLGDQNQTLKRFIRDADTDVRELERNKEDVARFVREAGQTAEIAATRENDIRRGFRLLPGFLRELRPTMARLGQFSDNAVPTLIDLQRAAPQLRRFLVETRPFARTTRPVLRSLGRTSEAGIEAINASDEEIRQLRRAAQPLPPRGSRPSEQGLARPLRQLLLSMDDRSKSIEEDRRAQQTGPPSYDPTAWRPGEGFTGFEAIVNYAYWQALGINIRDDVSHFLRVLLIADPECSPYNTDGRDPMGTRDVTGKCSGYMGDYQPCVPGYAQPEPAIRNRDYICGGGGASGASAGSAGGPDARRGKREAGAAPAEGGPPPSRTRAQGDRPAQEKRPPSAADRRRLDPPAKDGDPGSATTKPNTPGDKDLKLMDYFLGEGR